MASKEKKRRLSSVRALPARSYQISFDNKFHSYVMMFAEREIACSQSLEEQSDAIWMLEKGA
jgi:hypothetical protein